LLYLTKKASNGDSLARDESGIYFSKMLKIGFTPQNYLDCMKIFNEFIDENNYLHPIFFKFIESPENS
jgi:hypothetical protein